MKKIEKWIFHLKRLPNTKKEISSALCNAVLIVFATAVYFTAKAVGYKLGTNWLIGFVVGAKLLSTPLFFAWAKFAIDLEKNPY
jgi:hypothetical protein